MRRLGKVISGAVMLAAAPAAQAAVVYGTFSGTVASGIDTSGYFVGAANAGQALDAAAVTGTFAYDDVAPTGSGFGFSIRLAGAGFGETYSFGSFAAPASGLAIEGSNGPDTFSLSLERADDTTTDSEALSLFLDGTEFLTANGIPSGFTFANAGAANNGVLTVSRPTGGIDFSAFLSITNVSAAIPVSPVPEPSSWALMIVGFGIAGGALRYRGRAARQPIVAS